MRGAPGLTTNGAGGKSRWRWALTAALAGCLTYGALEATSAIFYRLHYGKAFSFARVAAQRSLVPYDLDGRRGVRARTPWVASVLHPFLGYVFDPSDPAVCTPTPPLRCEENGFHSEMPLRPARAPDTVIVGIVGGSVAYWLSAQARGALTAELERIPALAGKRFEVVNLANGGYKQPQQFLAVAYLLSLGTAFDIIINVDGFNDIVLPAAENVKAGTFPFYPRGWHLFAGDLDDRSLLGLGRLALARAERSDAARWMARSPLRHSVTANLLWSLRDDAGERRIYRLERGLQASTSPWRSYRLHGPARHYASPERMYQDLARVWRQSSLELAWLAAANGIRYFHFLQPNQYDPGAKPLTPEERRTAYSEASPYRPHVEGGYGYLRAEGRTLAAAGVHFHDLSRMFAADHRTLYSDTCCHFNDEGSFILATQIGGLVQEALRRGAAPPGAGARHAVRR